MSLKIYGNLSPAVGKEEKYTIKAPFEEFNLFPPPLQPIDHKVKWYIYVLENGKWRKTKENEKTGETVSYTFTQKSLSRKGIKIEAQRGFETASEVIKPQRAEEQKILKVELLDLDGNKLTKPLSYGQTVVAKATCTGLEYQMINLTLWEDDAKGAAHSPINQKNRATTKTVEVKRGIAKTSFKLMPSFAKMAEAFQTNGGEGKTHEYYVTATIQDLQGVSNNIDVNALEEPAPTVKKKVPVIDPKKPNIPKPNAPTKPSVKKEITDVKLIKTSETALKVHVYHNGLQGKKIRFKLMENDGGALFDDELINQVFDLPKNSDCLYIDIDLKKVSKSKGDDMLEGSEQELFVDIEVLETASHHKTATLNVNNSGFKQDPVDDTNKVVKVAVEEKKEGKEDKGKCPNCDKPVTAQELKQIFTGADNATLEKAATTYTKYMKELGMNTCWNKAHFFAQARIESGAELHVKSGENFNWYWESLISTFGAFQTSEGRQKAKLWGRAVKNRRDPNCVDVTIENQKKIANYAYSPPAKKAKELGNTKPNDGWNYRGRGLIQVTGKGFYEYCNQYTIKHGYDIIMNPDLLNEKIELAVSTSMIFFKWKGINKIANGTKDVKKKICPLVGKNVIVGNKNNYNEKQESFDDTTSKIFKIDKCQWGKIDDAPISSDSVLEEMKRLVDQHIPYSQSGVRNKLNTEGLKNLDCSETVGIYLHKLGVMPNYKAIDTSTMTTEVNFRKTIGTANIDLVSGSNKKDFKPQRGDIFVWRKGTAGPGHTGIVYEYDAATDVVTILEAIGKAGAVSESSQVKNGGYSGTLCSRTAKYSRLKGALYGHKGWVGYFRPKNYTKKL